MMTIESINLSTSLYNKLKRQGINYVKDIPDINYHNLKKDELIELILNFGVFE